MSKKRYLITYTEKGISTQKMNSVLGDKELIVEYKSTTKLHEKGAYHFRNLGITSLLLSEEEVRELAANDDIDIIEEDRPMTTLGELVHENKHVTAANGELWNISMVKAPEAWKKGFTGKGVKLAIIDTGIATHPDLSVKGGVSTVPGISSYNDDDGHGTHCAGIAAGLGKKPENVRGVAHEASLYAVKVLKKGSDGRSTGETTWIIAGMAWCVENEMNVISMSLGGKEDPGDAYAVAVKNCQNVGITVVCASGNSYESAFPYVNAPANSYYEGIPNARPIAVGSVDSNSDIAPTSSRGGKNADWNPVGVVAPGVQIYSTYLNNGYATMSGTSMACPHVAGLAALMVQKDANLKPIQIKADIFSTAKALGGSQPNNTYGHGLINCDAATKA